MTVLTRDCPATTVPYGESVMLDAEGPGAVVSQGELEQYLRDSKILLYDRSGEEHYNIASAFIKSLRGSDADASLYWGFRMLEAGEDPRFVIRRLVIFASEDIGNADPRAMQVALSKSFWCVVGSFGFGSMRNVPVKPIFFL